MASRTQRKNRRRPKKKNWLPLFLAAIIFFVSGYGFFWWFERHQSKQSTAELWQQLKRRLLDQDLPQAQIGAHKNTDILEISSSPPGEGPEKSMPSSKDRNNLEKLIP